MATKVYQIKEFQVKTNENYLLEINIYYTSPIPIITFKQDSVKKLQNYFFETPNFYKANQKSNFISNQILS